MSGCWFHKAGLAIILIWLTTVSGNKIQTRIKETNLPFLIFKCLRLPVIKLLILWRKFRNHLCVHVRAPWGLNRCFEISCTTYPVVIWKIKLAGDSKVAWCFCFLFDLACSTGRSAFPSYLSAKKTTTSRWKLSLIPHRRSRGFQISWKWQCQIRLPCQSVVMSALVDTTNYSYRGFKLYTFEQPYVIWTLIRMAFYITFVTSSQVFSWCYHYLNN